MIDPVQYIQYKHTEVEGFYRIASHYQMAYLATHWDETKTETLNFMLFDKVSRLMWINVKPRINLEDVKVENRQMLIDQFIKACKVVERTNPEDMIEDIINPEYGITYRLIQAAPTIIDVIIARKEEHGDGYFKGDICTW